VSIISNFSDDMIIDIIYRNSENKFRPYQYYIGNLVSAIESTFKANQEDYPNYYPEIMNRRNEMYYKILESLCSLHKLSLNIDENTDLYSLAYFLYDFTISRFTINIINFFANYIINEIDSIYQYLDINNMKKKDNSSTYSKKLFKNNSKLATIHANLDIVIDNICGFDINLETLIMTSTNDKNITSLIINNIGEVSNLFKTLFVSCAQDVRYKAIIITLIRMRLQEIEGTVELSVQ